MKSFKNSSLYLSLLCLITLFFVNSLLAQRVELVERRSIFSKTFRNPDNTLTAEISPGPVHFRDTDGSLQEINRNIVPSNTEFDFEVTQGFYHVYFKGDLQSEYPVVFESKDGANLKMKLTAVFFKVWLYCEVRACSVRSPTCLALS